MTATYQHHSPGKASNTNYTESISPTLILHPRVKHLSKKLAGSLYKDREISDIPRDLNVLQSSTAYRLTDKSIISSISSEGNLESTLYNNLDRQVQSLPLAN
ncbi:hypothetical protein TNCT_232511 [Trichonephila clavata]|uniref:Uncharacterized protein n=1 Tax=Trichonephila clavata TaxID=2740835 RepID=A0A8X6K9Q7_TRICU|nr:hypothetical protein TNCT_232511 [Trichonephila clavata]